MLELSNLFKVQNLKKLKEEIEALDILYLRHCIAEHPVNFQNENKKFSFKIDRSSVNSNGYVSLLDENNKKVDYNIFESLKNYLKLVEISLEIMSIKLVNSAFKTTLNKRVSLLDEIKKINQ
ncbi:hypothetical protein [Formosa sp. PL04]|uniref:hypothetical protein n=1 Tax=Formosa sp. PL04 TaxID=3081755 RepID=UPI002980DE84|nr:hypothetical protein [Formosa sp. PL04]MDW5289591.1 hypothetical protein [Formosa sp. PL04]